MSKIRERGSIIEAHRGGKFKVKLQDLDHCVIATLSGKIRKTRIILCLGDDVSVELSPYDLTKGRIVWRH